MLQIRLDRKARMGWDLDVTFFFYPGSGEQFGAAGNFGRCDLAGWRAAG